MAFSSALAQFSLDITTLSTVAIVVTGMLGVFLIAAWMQDRIPALAWWGAAYLIGGLSVAVWMMQDAITPPAPRGLANAFLFIACGMIWNAARLFHGRNVRWGALTIGAAIWLFACLIPAFLQSFPARIMLSSAIIASYTFLTAAELWRERRRSLIRSWPAIFVPVLHGAVFLFPIPLAALVPGQRGVLTLATGWVTVFAVEMLLYAVGTAFLVLALTKERAVRIHKSAAATDTLTGVLNRRGFNEAALQLIAKCARKNEPITALAFDLDHFKSINDRFGHSAGDAALRVFASTIGTQMRATDIVARLGGEEFVALLPSTLQDGISAAERVRLAFMAAGVEIAGRPMNATVSVGAASASGADIDIDALVKEADVALYQAKITGRNRVSSAAMQEFALAS